MTRISYSWSSIVTSITPCLMDKDVSRSPVEVQPSCLHSGGPAHPRCAIGSLKHSKIKLRRSSMFTKPVYWLSILVMGRESSGLTVRKTTSYSLSPTCT